MVWEIIVLEKVIVVENIIVFGIVWLVGMRYNIEKAFYFGSFTAYKLDFVNPTVVQMRNYVCKSKFC